MKLKHSLRLILTCLLLASPAALSPSAFSADGSKSEGLLNKLLAPGPLMRGHAELEGTDCLKCHTPSEGIPNSKCLDCHKEIRPSVMSKTGFHGLTKKSCTECHTDHKGRDFDSTKIDPKSFDHSTTGYLLQGKHAELDCKECHVEKRAKAGLKTRPNDLHFLGLKTSCVSCHKKDDPHRFKGDWAKKDCNACHEGKAWKENVHFDHEKDAHFKLEGKHAQLKCADCHTPKDKPVVYAWKNLKQGQCLSCHVDQHKGNLSPKFQGGASCVKCHTQSSWKVPTFEHAKQTGYELKGKHAELKCAECHKQTPAALKSGMKSFHWAGLKGQCLSCHKDQHHGMFSAKFQGPDSCVKCHGETTWKLPRFDHARITGYELKGKHAELKCAECHKQTPQALKSGLKAYQWKGLQGGKEKCLTCHKDQHGFGMFKTKKLPDPNQCQSCHVETTWKEVHGFDHNKDTRYAIGGKHVGLKCEQCHTLVSKTSTQRTYFWQALPEKTCETCHASPHKKTFSPDLLAKRCTECHVDSGWNIIGKNKFDHDKTRFALTGKHKELSCKDCHGPAKQQVMHFANAEKQFCMDCHKNVHVGQFSKAQTDKSCAECHGTTNFTERKTFDHNQTRFKIDGAHEKLDCAKCHTPTQEMFEAKPPQHAHPKSRFLFNEADKGFCVSCHANVHEGQFRKSTTDQSCTACHTTQDFTHRLSFNHATTTFPLRGKHSDLDCRKCHVATNQTFPAPYKHRKDRFLFPEILSRDCATCHKDPHDGKFGKKCSECHQENSWKSTKDFHKNFTLSGVHFSLECTECHRDGRKLAGMSQNCALCHQKDDIHNGTLPNCGSCHLQHFWESSKFKHSLTNFPLRGVHRTLDCYSCHDNGIYKGTPVQCAACHLQQGLSSAFHSTPTGASKLSQSCDVCHNQFSFR